MNYIEEYYNQINEDGRLTSRNVSSSKRKR